MKILAAFLFLICFQSFAQLTGTISGTNTVCAGASGSYNITFDGFMGTAPYTFFYNINGGATQSITTISGSTVAFAPSLATPGVFNYNLTSVQDATMALQTLNATATLTVNALPNVNGGANQVVCQGDLISPTPSGAMTYSYVPPMMNPTSSGNYTVYGSDMNGCIGSGTFSVTVNPLPIVNAGTDQQICFGQTAQLAATGALSFQWTPTASLDAANIYNPIAAPSVTTTYTVTGTNASGCINTDQVIVSVNPIPVVNAGPDQTICYGTSVVVTGSGAGVITYIWDNGIVNNTPFIPAVTATYTVTGYDNIGCFSSDQLTIFVNPLPLDPGAIVDSAYCNDGAISIIQSPQTVGYTYLWMTGNTASNISGLAAGPYVCYMMDPNGCSNQFTYVVPNTLLPMNCAQINGTVYFDNDQNCIIGIGDNPVANRVVMVTPGNYLAVTDQNGYYTFQLPVGTYSVSEIFNTPSYGNYCNQVYNITLANLTDISSNNDFMDTISGNMDLQAGIYSSTVVPGFPFSVQPYFSSMNTIGTLLNANAWFTIPAGVIMQTWTYPHTVSNDTVYFTINTPQSFNSVVPFIAPAGLMLGMPLTFCAGVDVQPSEIIASNNTSCFSSIVIGSFDPNDKTMFLNGVQSDSTIYLTDVKLDYVIRFQNTGTAPAQDIFILDTINSTLDLSSFEYIASSHPCTISILEGNVLKFNFPQIMLPDSTNNEPESHGYVHYRIRQSNQNAIGTIINNTAYIYFDFNEAVVTNTTYDIIEIDDLGLVEEQLFKVKVYPNPAEAVINIESDILIETIEITDLNGHFVNGYFSNSQTTTIDLSYLTSGIYFIKMNAFEGSVVKRIVVQ